MVYYTVNKALRFTSPGSVLTLVEKDIPPLPANEVLVQVHAASINPVDVQLWKSPLVAAVPGDKGMGRDFSGTVVAVGSEVRGWDEGDQIFGLLFHIAEASSIPLAAETAYACLAYLPTTTSTTPAQHKIIIRGASGGTGTWLVQLAKAAYNCHVTAICSGANAEYVKDLGADEVVDYTKLDIASTLLEKAKREGRYDLIVDCVGGMELVGAYPALLSSLGAYTTIVGPKINPSVLGGPITYLTHPRQILWYLHGLVFGPRYANVSFLTEGKYLEEVARLVERGEVRCVVQEVLEGGFAEDGNEGWRKAAEAMEEGRTRGKIVLAVS